MEEIDTSNLIPVAGGDYMRYRNGEKKGQYITLAEFSALSRSKQSGLLLAYDPEHQKQLKVTAQALKKKYEENPALLAEREAKYQATIARKRAEKALQKEALELARRKELSRSEKITESKIHKMKTDPVLIEKLKKIKDQEIKILLKNIQIRFNRSNLMYRICLTELADTLTGLLNTK